MHSAGTVANSNVLCSSSIARRRLYSGTRNCNQAQHCDDANFDTNSIRDENEHEHSHANRHIHAITDTLSSADSYQATANAHPEQLALKHFQEGREWLNPTDANDVPKGASRYFTGKALRQTLEGAQWEIERRARYKVGGLTDKLCSALSNEGILVFESTSAGKAVQYDENWKPIKEFDVNPLSIVYVTTFEAKCKRWKIDHTKSAVDKVTGKSVLEP